MGKQTWSEGAVRCLVMRFSEPGTSLVLTAPLLGATRPSNFTIDNARSVKPNRQAQPSVPVAMAVLSSCNWSSPAAIPTFHLL